MQNQEPNQKLKLLKINNNNKIIIFKNKKNTFGFVFDSIKTVSGVSSFGEEFLFDGDVVEIVKSIPASVSAFCISVVAFVQASTLHKVKLIK